MIINEANRLKSVDEYYFSKKLQEVAGLKAQGKNIINLGIGSPDLLPSPETINRLCNSVNMPNVHGYQSYKGVVQLRNSIANWYQKTYNLVLNPEDEILPLIGSKEGIMHLSMAFLNQGDKVLVPNPGYPTYTSVSRLCGADIIYYNLIEKNNWNIDFAELEKLNLSGTKIMWINYPHMPTGSAATIDVLKKIVEFGHRHNILICSDNPYSLILNENPVSILNIDGAKEVSVELNSMSKSHNMAGWRMGWIAGKPEYLNSVLKVKSNMDSGMFLPMQLAAAEALNNSVEWHNRQNEIYKNRRKLVYQLLDCLKCTYSDNQSGMFVWAKISNANITSEKFIDDLLYNKNVFLTPGTIFGSNGEGYVRVSLCASETDIQSAINNCSNQ
jgi:LL-diaminopimelate aminotransferase